MTNSQKQGKVLHTLVMSMMSGVVLFGACTADTPEIYRIRNSQNHPTTFRQISQSAQTEAGRTIATFQFEDEQSTRLEITLEFKKAVPPEFTDGSFHLIMGGENHRGIVSPVNFRYLGGQGDGVSVGGDFQFSTSGSQYRFHLPLTSMNTFGY
ncbi:MAG: hypothetical protein K9N11_02050 [Lentisphaeria bacterium]|nr:hypothetical protein [Candidatus Neomarinimicrobiota bacterium]MCF7841612.1 hypothetical protein [Lentisphaeria bacterium]